MVRVWVSLTLFGFALCAPADTRADWKFWKKSQPACPPQACPPRPACPPVQLAPPTEEPRDMTPQPDGSLPPSPEQDRTPSTNQQPPETQPRPQNLNIPQNTSTARSSGGQSAAPSMIGDFFGTGSSSQGRVVIDRLWALSSNDFDSNPFTQTYTGIGPVPVYEAASGSALEIFNGGPAGAVVGSFNQDQVVVFGVGGADVAAANAAAVANGDPSFFVAAGTPPGVYTTEMQTIFEGRNGAGGTTQYEGANSGIIVQADDSDPFGDDFDALYFYNYGLEFEIPGGPAGAPGAMVGRMKLAENTSPIPRDRVYANYSYFNNTALAPGLDVNRVTPGFEKTFFDGNMSFELRTPFATTLDSNINQGGITNSNNAEFGNMTMYLKALIYNDDVFAFSTGLGVAVPTADDVVVRDATGTQLLRVDNKSVHLLPFVGGLYTPNDRLFVQGFLQMDIDTNGNPVSASEFVNGVNTGNLSRIDRPHDFTYLFFDVSVGYWLFLDPSSDRFITGLAPMVEYHLNQTVGGSGGASGMAGTTQWNINSPEGISTSNGVIGMTALIRNDATVTLAYATPLHAEDRQFDGEMRLMFNWLFGNSKPVNRMMRAPSF